MIDPIVGEEYPITLEAETSDFEINKNCIGSLTCKFWQTPFWDDGYVEYELACPYLVFDVCKGTYACECSNNYFMTTSAMRNLSESDLE